MAFQSSDARANCLSKMSRFDEGVQHVCTFFNVSFFFKINEIKGKIIESD